MADNKENKESIQEAAEKRAEAIQRKIGNVKDKISEVKDDVKEEITGDVMAGIVAAEIVKKNVVKKANAVGGKVVEGAGFVKDSVVHVGQGVAKGAKTAGREVAITGLALGKISLKAFKKIFNYIKNGILKPSKRTKGSYKNPDGKLNKIVKSVRGLFGKTKQGAEFVKDSFVHVGQGVAKGAKTVGGKVVEGAEFVGNSFVNVGNEVAEGTIAVAETVKNGVDKGIEHGINFANTAKNVTKEKANQAKDTILTRANQRLKDIKTNMANKLALISNKLKESASKNDAKINAINARKNEVTGPTNSHDDGQNLD